METSLVIGIVILLIILFFVFFYNPPHAEGMADDSVFNKYLSENQSQCINPQNNKLMVSPVDWSLTSNGLSASNSCGYDPYLRLISSMERSDSKNIQVDARMFEDANAF